MIEFDEKIVFHTWSSDNLTTDRSIHITSGETKPFLKNWGVNIRILSAYRCIFRKTKLNGSQVVCM